VAGHKLLGDRGEALAADRLERAGWTVTHRNFRMGRKEIDLVARRDGVVAFVEVKTRAGAGYGHPLEAITWKKRREIAQVAQAWIDRHGRSGEAYRFDAVAVTFTAGGVPVVEHVEDAWRL
jgi:putative endonuclease